MSRTLRRSSRRHFVRHPWQALLAVLGVSLGVAVVVSIDLASSSALKAFSLSSEAVAGRATHIIDGGPTGLPEELFAQLRRRGVRPSAPVVHGYLALADQPGRLLQILGLDPFSESGFRSYLDRGSPDLDLVELLTQPGSVWASAQTAADLAVEPGDELALDVNGVRRTAVLAGLLEGHELREGSLADLLVADISTAQEILGFVGRLNRIDLLLPAGDDGEQAALELAATLPEGVRIDRAASAGVAAERMTAAFRTNLQALSLLALLCGGFLIYNTVSFAVVQRRALFGAFRALGVTRRELLRLVLGEALIIGTLGCALGLIGGVLLGKGLVAQVTRTINDLYFTVAVQHLTLDPLVLAKGAVLGVGASLLAALAPAIEAMSASPRSALDRSELESRTHRALPATTLAGGLLIVAAWLLLATTTGGLTASFAGLFALLVGFALLTPIATVGMVALLTPVAGALFGQLGRIAGRGVVTSLSRTAVAIAALMIAVSVIIGVDVMVRSFRNTVQGWLEYSLPADLYISSGSAPTSGLPGARQGFDVELVRSLAEVDGVDGMSTLKQTTARIGESSSRLIAVDLDPRSHDSFAFKDGDPDKIWSTWERGEVVIVSEPYASRTGRGVGSEVEIQTPRGTRSWPVAGVYFDYASELGAVTLARRTYAALWNDEGVTAISVRVAPGRSPEGVADDLREAGGGRRLLIRSNQAIRQESLTVFDRTFMITGTLRMLATVVAFVGVLSALMALQMERARELGTLRAQGMTPGQLWGLVTAQTGMMGLIAGALAVPVGLATAAVMIYVVNQRSFGWTLEMQVGAEPLLTALGVAIGAALLAGLYPAFRMARTSPAEALRAE